MLYRKISVNKFKKTEIISAIFSNYSGMKLEINYKNKTGTIRNMWRLNTMLLNSQWVNEAEITAEIKKYLEGFPGGTVVKNPPANAGDTGSSPGPGRSHMQWSN